MKCQYFVAFILITICSRIILSNFLYEKERRDREESNATEESILAIVFPEIHSVIVFFISLFDEMSIFCCFYTHNYMFPNNLFNFLMKKKEETERNLMQPRNSSQLSYFQRYTLLQCSSFHYSMKCQYFVAFILITICSRIILSNFLYEKERRDQRGI